MPTAWYGDAARHAVIRSGDGAVQASKPGPVSVPGTADAGTAAAAADPAGADVTEGTAVDGMGAASAGAATAAPSSAGRPSSAPRAGTGTSRAKAPAPDRRATFMATSTRKTAPRTCAVCSQRTTRHVGLQPLSRSWVSRIRAARPGAATGTRGDRGRGVRPATPP